MSEDQVRVRDNSGFEFETETLGRIHCWPFDLKLLFRFVDLMKLAPDTVRACACALLSVVGERWDPASFENRRISTEQAKNFTDQELEQFAERFLEAANWIETVEKAESTQEGAAEWSHAERLKRTFETYEKRLAEKTTFYPLPEAFSAVVSDHGEQGSIMIEDARMEPKRPASWDSASRNGDLEQTHRPVGAVRTGAKRLSGNGGEISGTSQLIRELLGSLKTGQQDLLNCLQIRFRTLQKIGIGKHLEKITVYAKTFQSKSGPWETKPVYIHLAGLLVIGVFISLVLDLVALRNLRAQELAAIVNLSNTVHALSDRMDAQTKTLAQLIEQHDSEQRSAAPQTTQLDAKPKKRSERHQRQHSSLGVQHRKARHTSLSCLDAPPVSPMPAG